MSLPGIILTPPNVLCVATNSGLGAQTLQVQGTDYIFGSIQEVYDTCDDVSVGQILYFDALRTPRILYGSTIYYLVDITKKVFKEPLPS